MGVPGLWDVWNEAGKVTSVAKLAVIDGFQQNPSGMRAYRVGVDMSIWFEHAKSSKKGENPVVRGLFFQLVKLSKLPLIPLFVFDGRERPKVKRGSKMGKSGSHYLSRPFKRFLDAFGMEWREAPGEAEAELAFLNKEGHIDAVLTDDCDALIFGAQTLMKNLSDGLTGNKKNLAKNSNDKTDEFHTWIYKASDIANAPVDLQQGGLILFALLVGGDYDKGVHGIGKSIAHRLARCGLGEELLQAFQNLPGPLFSEFVGLWRFRINQELAKISPRTILPETFPPLDVLENYARPLDSGNKPGAGPSSSLALRDRKNMDVGQIAGLCKEYFEWGNRQVIIERFSRLIWPGAVMHVLRRAALEVDDNEKMRGHSPEVGTPPSLVQRCLGGLSRADRISGAFVNRDAMVPYYVPVDNVKSSPLISQIVGSREHTSTDATLEYRVEVLPSQLVQLANVGIVGKRPPLPPKEGTGEPKESEDPNKVLRLWIPAVIMERVHPTMVDQFVLKQSSKGQKKGKGKQRASSPLSMPDDYDINSAVYSSPMRSQPIPQSLPASQTSNPATTQHAFPSFADRTNTTGFLFAFDNPDRAQFEDFMEVEETYDDLEDEHPATYFEALCDRIITAPAKSSKSRKRKTYISDAPVESYPVSKRPRKSLLDILDEI